MSSYGEIFLRGNTEDERGLVIPLEDKDLKEALMNYPQHGVEAIEEII